MNENFVIKTLILTISFMGLAIFVFGFFFYFFRNSMVPYIHYILPIPPVGVASYVFVFNLYLKYKGSLPQDIAPLIFEIGMATLSAAIIFLLSSVVIILVMRLTQTIL